MKAHKINQGDIYTSITTAPATARTTNPTLMVITSIRTIFFRKTEYKMVITEYERAHHPNSWDKRKADPLPSTKMNTEEIIPDFTVISPEAMGLFDFS